MLGESTCQGVRGRDIWSTPSISLRERRSISRCLRLMCGSLFWAWAFQRLLLLDAFFVLLPTPCLHSGWSRPVTFKVGCSSVLHLLILPKGVPTLLAHQALRGLLSPTAQPPSPVLPWGLHACARLISSGASLFLSCGSYHALFSLRGFPGGPGQGYPPCLPVRLWPEQPALLTTLSNSEVAQPSHTVCLQEFVSFSSVLHIFLHRIIIPHPAVNVQTCLFNKPGIQKPLPSLSMTKKQVSIPAGGSLPGDPAFPSSSATVTCPPGLRRALEKLSASFIGVARLPWLHITSVGFYLHASGSWMVFFPGLRFTMTLRLDAAWSERIYSE